MSDGLTVPFALAAGLSGAVDSTSIIVIAGIAEIAAGSIAMGLGGYLAGKTEQDHYSLSYDAFVVPLVKSVQELSKEVDLLKKENELLKLNLEEIKKLITASAANKTPADK